MILTGTYKTLIKNGKEFFKHCSFNSRTSGLQLFDSNVEPNVMLILGRTNTDDKTDNNEIAPKTELKPYVDGFDIKHLFTMTFTSDDSDVEIVGTSSDDFPVSLKTSHDELSFVLSVRKESCFYLDFSVIPVSHKTFSVSLKSFLSVLNRISMIDGSGSGSDSDSTVIISTGSKVAMCMNGSTLTFKSAETEHKDVSHKFSIAMLTSDCVLTEVCDSDAASDSDSDSDSDASSDIFRTTFYLKNLMKIATLFNDTKCDTINITLGNDFTLLVKPKYTKSPYTIVISGIPEP